MRSANTSDRALGEAYHGWRPTIAPHGRDWLAEVSGKWWRGASSRNLPAGPPFYGAVVWDSMPTLPSMMTRVLVKLTTAKVLWSPVEVGPFPADANLAGDELATANHASEFVANDFKRQAGV